jgi:hypothetical protein
VYEIELILSKETTFKKKASGSNGLITVLSLNNVR